MHKIYLFAFNRNKKYNKRIEQLFLKCGILYKNTILRMLQSLKYDSTFFFHFVLFLFIINNLICQGKIWKKIKFIEFTFKIFNLLL